LGFHAPAGNSLDAVGSRDFALAGACQSFAIAATHLSRLAEEIVLWTSAAIRFRRAERCVVDRLVDHAAESAIRTRLNSSAPRPRAWAPISRR
jgi:hypothetical protein